MSKKKDAPQPMDTAIREDAVGAPATNHKRDCWAIKTLVAEFRSLFPETPYETSNLDGRNTALDVTFDLTVLDEETRTTAISLLWLLHGDKRVRGIVREDDAVCVSMHSNPRTQDSREPFNIPEAYDVLITEAEEGGSW